MIEQSVVKDGVTIGPFAHVRPDSTLEKMFTLVTLLK